MTLRDYQGASHVEDGIVQSLLNTAKAGVENACCCLQPPFLSYSLA